MKLEVIRSPTADHAGLAWRGNILRIGGQRLQRATGDASRLPLIAGRRISQQADEHVLPDGNL